MRRIENTEGTIRHRHWPRLMKERRFDFGGQRAKFVPARALLAYKRIPQRSEHVRERKTLFELLHETRINSPRDHKSNRQQLELTGNRSQNSCFQKAFL